jgi:hypothetical protein
MISRIFSCGLEATAKVHIGLKCSRPGRPPRNLTLGLLPHCGLVAALRGKGHGSNIVPPLENFSLL